MYDHAARFPGRVQGLTPERRDELDRRVTPGPDVPMTPHDKSELDMVPDDFEAPDHEAHRQMYADPADGDLPHLFWRITHSPQYGVTSVENMTLRPALCIKYIDRAHKSGTHVTHHHLTDQLGRKRIYSAQDWQALMDAGKAKLVMPSTWAQRAVITGWENGNIDLPSDAVRYYTMAADVDGDALAFVEQVIQNQ